MEKTTIEDKYVFGWGCMHQIIQRYVFTIDQKVRYVFTRPERTLCIYYRLTRKWTYILMLFITYCLCAPG